MASHWYTTWLPDAASHLGPLGRDWIGTVLEWMRRPITSARVVAAALVRRLGAVSPDRWFLLAFVLLFVVFFVVLFIQPSSVGRGGR